jgi:glutaredoxin-related protein
MRDRRKIISLDTDSALALMQEIYNDIVEQKNIASQITKKMLLFMKDAEDMPIIGSVIDKQQKILQDCTEKKISLVKLQGAMLKQSGADKNGNKQFSQLQLSPEDRDLLNKMIEEKDDKNAGDENEDEKYKI